MKNKKNIYATLSWQLTDYQQNNFEIPDRIKKYPQKTEGEMMSAEEIEFWLADSIKTLQILKEEDVSVFQKIHQGFLMDLEYLLNLGKIEEDVLDLLIEEKSFDFNKEENEN